jgi:hypothetical protein
MEHSWSVRNRYFALALLLLGSCCVLFPVPRDAVTLWELDDLKQKSRELYQSFTLPTIDRGAIDSLDNQWKALQAREDAKGNCNAIMAAQIRRCREMFGTHVRNRTEGAPWTSTHRDNLIENMTDAIDLAHATELRKDP